MTSSFKLSTTVDELWTGDIFEISTTLAADSVDVVSILSSLISIRFAGSSLASRLSPPRPNALLLRFRRVVIDGHGLDAPIKSGVNVFQVGAVGVDGSADEGDDETKSVVSILIPFVGFGGDDDDDNEFNDDIGSALMGISGGGLADIGVSTVACRQSSDWRNGDFEPFTLVVGWRGLAVSTRIF